MEIEIPDYLKDPTNIGHKYGEITYETGKFVIRGEPILVDFVRRVFPGASIYRNNDSRIIIGNTHKEVADLNWLMMRYPLDVKCEKEFKACLEKTVTRWKSREQGDDLKPTNPPSEFLGELFEYQKEAVTYMVSNRRTLLGDSMGLGKTWSALGAAAQVGKYPVLVVCPTNVQSQWQRAIGALFDLPSDYSKELFDTELDVSIKRGEDLAEILKGRTTYDIKDKPFTILHYGLIADWKDKLRDRGYKVVIFDEVQELRHTGTYKYSAASVLSEEAEYCWGTSGTPVYGYGIEIWSVLNSIEYHCLGSSDSFTREWCTGYGEKIVEKPRALHGHLTREGLLLRRRYEEVMPKLPKVARLIKDVNQDDELYESLVASAKRKAEAWLPASFTERGRLSREIEGETRRAAGIAKAKYVAEFVASLIEGGEKPLLYAWHHDVHDILKESLGRYNFSIITGRQTPKQKDYYIRKFMRGESDVILLSLRSAAGIDGLQHQGTCCVFAELDYSPAIHSQAETRVARIGAEDRMTEVPSYYCVSKSGYDQVMLDILGLKVGQFVGIMGDEPEDEEERKILEQKAVSRIKMLIDNLRG